MMPGKRSGTPGHHPMRRTTSVTEFAPRDVLAHVAEEGEDEALKLPVHAEEEASAEKEEDPYGWAVAGGVAGRSPDLLAAYHARAVPVLLLGRRNLADFSVAEAAAFLRACGLCNRRLGPGRDTFMYRGDMAFCSLECRQQHITIEEWKYKCAAALAKPESDDPVEPATASERTDDSGTTATTTAPAAAGEGRGGGMLAAA